jgi:hypothetical protein
MSTFKFCEDIEVYGIRVRVSGTYYPGDPGMYEGVPEDCWPAEPEDVELDRIELNRVDISEVCSEHFWQACGDAALRAIKAREEDNDDYDDDK